MTVSYCSLSPLNMTQAGILPVLFLKCHSVFSFSVNEVQYKSYYFYSKGQVAWLLNTRRHDLCDGRNMATTRIKMSVSFLFLVTSLCTKNEQMNRYIRTLHLQQIFLLSKINALLYVVLYDDQFKKD